MPSCVSADRALRMSKVKDYFLKRAAELDQEAVRIADSQLRTDYREFARSLRQISERVTFIDTAEMERGPRTWMSFPRLR